MSNKKKSNKINIKQILKLNNCISVKNKKKNNNEESYNIISNDSLNKEKKKNKTLCSNEKGIRNTFSCKKFGYKNDLDYREKRLKRLFSKFIKNISGSGSDNKSKNNKEKINLKKDRDCIKLNIISNLNHYNNITLSNKNINFFLCSESTKKEYGIESPKMTINNHILSYFYPNSVNKNECFKFK